MYSADDGVDGASGGLELTDKIRDELKQQLKSELVVSS